MELLGRLATVVGISLVITLLLIVLYQDDGQLDQGPVMTEMAATTTGQGTP